MASRGLTIRWWLAVAAAVVAVAAGDSASTTADPASSAGPADAAVLAADPADLAGSCLQLIGCHCQQPGALHCQLSDTGELRAVTSRLPTRPDIHLVDLVVRDLPSLPGGLFSGSTLQALLLSGSRAEVLPVDLLHGLNDSLRALGLGENQLQRVPTAALNGLTRLERLDLSGNRLWVMEAGSLLPLSRLAELNLADNELTRLDAGSLLSLTALRTLRLEGNRLTGTELSAGALRPLTSLESLSLDHNLLSGPLTSHLTSAFPPDVAVLSITDNDITSVSSGALAPLALLTSLDLSGNRIDLIETRAFAGLSQLRSLRLDGNKIVTLPAGGFSGLKALTELDLSRNALQALTEDVLTPLPALRRLLLRSNDLIRLDGRLLRTLPALKTLDLAENSLHCDCRLQELASYLSDSSSWLDGDAVGEITCSTPPSLENAPLVNLTTDQLTCRPPPNNAIHPTSLPASDADSDLDDVIRLEAAQLTADGDSVRLRWRVESGFSPYRCEQVALASGPESVQPCSAPDLADPTVLQMALRAAGLMAGERYQFCVTLTELTPGEELRMAPACRWAELAAAPAALPQLENFSAKVNSAGRVTARMKLSLSEGRPPEDCAVAVVVLGARGPLSAVEASCTVHRVTMWAAVGAGSVRVCSTDPYRAAIPANTSRPLDSAAAVTPPSPPLHRCVEVRATNGVVWWQAAAAGAAAIVALGLLLGWTVLNWRRCRCPARHGGRTRLESSDSAVSDDPEASESDADEETDLPV